MQPRWILLLALSGFVAFAPAASAQTAETIPSLVMIGEAEQVGTPDVALLTLGVTRDGKTASQALRATTQAMRSVLDAVRKHGIEARDIQTSGLAVQPRYERPPQRPGGDDRTSIVGYSASNQLSLRARRLESLGELLDDAVAAGANDIRGLSFDVADRAKLLNEARIRAVEDAKRKATLYADAAGIRLGAIINLQEESISPEPRPMAARAGRLESAAAVPVEAGEITLRARVLMTWRIAN
jgi:uncharacterized protein YggE